MNALPHAAMTGAMTGAMAWMVAAMSSAMSMGATGGGHAHDMPGMDISAPGATATMTLSDTGDRWNAGLLALVPAGARTVVAREGLRHGPPRAPHGERRGLGRRGARSVGCHGLMALGMAVMFVVMV
ncbi:DUF5134 domain-containing protein [Streptomyces sp. NPDC127117]|uniref:DUF5134 domain-containing protein n=1 Tax=Streptomyces sp. NPDC127117 TaxID=3345368 RepID=UPI00364199F6